MNSSCNKSIQTFTKITFSEPRGSDNHRNNYFYVKSMFTPLLQSSKIKALDNMKEMGEKPRT